MLSVDILTDILENQRDLTPYGIPFLDNALHGISRNELIIIGAATGTGKTELLVNIALNASKTKKVIFFALEAEIREIQHRLVFKDLCKSYFALDASRRPQSKTGVVTYSAYRLGLLGEAFIPLITQSADRIEREISNLKIIYAEDLEIDDFINLVDLEFNNFDLWIVDHLHYFEWDDELKGVRDLMKAVRKIGVKRQVPIIFAAHLRKKDKFSSDFPEISELHGSSEISKRATTIIFLGEPQKGKFTIDKNHLPTIFHIAKSRHDGSLRHWYGLHQFDFQKRQYEPIYYLLEKKKEFEAIQDKNNFPKWAKNGIPFIGGF